MSTDMLPIDDESPFDRIKQSREDGSEFWSARDLMPLMGYPRWAEFQNPLGRAMSGARNQGHDVENQFRRSPKVIEGGRWGTQTVEDYQLARFAAYLVAMNGDPNKTEVAGAQAYFAIRTREAEVAAPVRELTFEEKALEVMAELQKRVAAQQLENQRQAAELEASKPYVARAKTYQASSRDQGRREFAREVCKWARGEAGVTITQNDVHDFLGRKLHLFITSNTKDHGQATADAEKRGLAVTEKDTTKGGYNWAAGRLTPKGQEYAWKRIVAHISEHGSLTLKEAA